MATKLIFALLLTVGLSGCGAKPPASIDWRTFDGRRAYDHVANLVNFGPRPSDSIAQTHAAAYIRSRLDEMGLDVEEQVFIGSSPRGSVHYRNIIGKTPTSHDPKRQIIVVGSHYDTKYLPNINFVGANDGGSSSGALLELARCAASQPDIWFVFFDGEEAVRDYSENDGLVGSKFFVEQLKADDRLGSIKVMILLDMVGDASLNITIPSNSTGGLTERVFEAARDVGCRDFFGSFKNGPMLDDHVPFLNAGLPAVDPIDFEFGSAPGLNDYWHTQNDTLDKISPQSLEHVGRTVLRLLAKLKAGEPVR